MLIETIILQLKQPSVEPLLWYEGVWALEIHIQLEVLECTQHH